ncbi:MAG: GIY-YIG nuclease family protein [Verrucomicrobia bacterium]|nr:GIY-YIG nuclease family protein [Verrucomicrobiota bacterium]
MYFVYILQSLSSGRFYVGQCDHLIGRFREHQRGANLATRNRGPWWMPYYEIYPTRTAAIKRERQIKKMKSAVSIGRIIGRFSAMA